MEPETETRVSSFSRSFHILVHRTDPTKKHKKTMIQLKGRMENRKGETTSGGIIITINRRDRLLPLNNRKSDAK